MPLALDSLPTDEDITRTRSTADRQFVSETCTAVTIYLLIAGWFALLIVVWCDSASRKPSAPGRENY
jgi:hypothetical protein